MAVVFYHYCFYFGVDDAARGNRPWPELAAMARYGHLGVQLFFMISGFLVLQSALSKDVAGFLRARVVRLYPAFLVCCTITYAAVAFIPGEPHALVNYLYNLTMLNGLVDSFRGVPPDYLDGSYWTLALEWKFYLLIAILIALRQLRYIERALWGWAAASVVACFHSSPWLVDYALTPWSAYFIAGAAFFRGHSRGWTAPRVVLVMAAFVLCLIHTGEQNEQLTAAHGTHFSMAVSLGIVTAGFALFAALSARPLRIGFLQPRLVVLLGALSYPVYLLHFRLGAAQVRLLWSRIDPVMLLVAMVAAVVIVAYIVHAGVERPAWRILRRRRAETFVPSAPLSAG